MIHPESVKRRLVIFIFIVASNLSQESAAHKELLPRLAARPALALNWAELLVSFLTMQQRSPRISSSSCTNIFPGIISCSLLPAAAACDATSYKAPVFAAARFSQTVPSCTHHQQPCSAHRTAFGLARGWPLLLPQNSQPGKPLAIKSSRRSPFIISQK